MIKGSGSLLSDETEEGTPLPFLTTEEILQQIAKFGFIVQYDLKSNLPAPVINYLSSLYNLGYDKINKLNVRVKSKDKLSYIQKTYVIVMKSCDETTNLMKFGKRVSEAMLDKFLRQNLIINATDEPDMVWDWVTHLFNIEDILNENIDPTDDFETDTDVQSSIKDDILIPEGYSIYTGEEDNEGEGS